MSKVYVKLYDDYRLSGADFDLVDSDTLRRLVFSPDNIHSVSVVRLSDGTLLFTNEAKVAFEMTISRERKVLAVIKYRQNTPNLCFNTNWMLNKDGVTNREIYANPDLILSKMLNIEVQAKEDIIRLDFKIENSGFACGVFSRKDLLFMRMNGNHAMPRLMDIINATPTEEEVNGFLVGNHQFREKVGKTFFMAWVQLHQWGLK